MLYLRPLFGINDDEPKSYALVIHNEQNREGILQEFHEGEPVLGVLYKTEEKVYFGSPLYDY